MSCRNMTDDIIGAEDFEKVQLVARCEKTEEEKKEERKVKRKIKNKTKRKQNRKKNK